MELFGYSYDCIVIGFLLVILAAIWCRQYFYLIPRFNLNFLLQGNSKTLMDPPTNISSNAGKKDRLDYRGNAVLFFGPGLPNEETQDKFLNYFRSAELSIQLCMFRFSCHKLRQIMQQKHNDGLIVHIIIDEDVYHDIRSRGTVIPELIAHEIKLRTLAIPKGMMHHKFAIIDGEIVMTGSLNWTNQAFHDNAEDVLISNNVSHVSKYQDRFDQLWSESRRC